MPAVAWGQGLHPEEQIARMAQAQLMIARVDFRQPDREQAGQNVAPERESSAVRSVQQVRQ